VTRATILDLRTDSPRKLEICVLGSVRRRLLGANINILPVLDLSLTALKKYLLIVLWAPGTFKLGTAWPLAICVWRCPTLSH
jgi:hypothetical protein